MDDIIADTERRMMQKEMLEKNLKTKSKQEVAQINSRSDKVMHDRFDNDFNTVCLELGIVKDELYSPNTMIDFSDMTQIFAKLGFVHAVSQEHEQQLLSDVWRHIGGDEEGKGEIPIKNCKNFLRAIQNFHHQDIIDSER